MNSCALEEQFTAEFPVLSLLEQQVQVLLEAQELLQTLQGL